MAGGLPGFVLDDDLLAIYNSNATDHATRAILVGIQLMRIIKALHLPGPVASFAFRPLWRNTMGQYTIGDNQFQDVSVIPEDAAGLPTVDPSPVTYVSSDPTICGTGPALDTAGKPVANAVRCTAATPPKLGTVTITVSDGKVTGAFTVTVIGGSVTQFGDTALGQPQNQVAA